MNVTPLLSLDDVKIDPAIALKVPAIVALRRQVLPFAELNGSIHVACMDPSDGAALQAVQRIFKKPAVAEPAEPESLRRALRRIYSENPVAAPNGSGTGQQEVVKLCDDLIRAAILRQASDMHLDPSRRGVVVRYRVDGKLEEHSVLPIDVHAELMTRIKVLAEMDIAERRSPQDGGFKFSLGGEQQIEVRAATLPTRYGERMTLRLLALQTEVLTLQKLGMSEESLRVFEQAIQRPHGQVIITGPTGCGKSTTLYAALRHLIAARPLNVITVEDPIEYEIAGVAQVEVDAAEKVSFNKVLRNVLRHDPDVIMIGEIRDPDTADIAVKAALTGHLVFTTLHTNSAVSTITRLIDMGVERYLIAATLRLAVAQRLVRKLCGHCKRKDTLSPAQAQAFGITDSGDAFASDGCIYCGGRGSNGRLGLFELLCVNNTLSRLIAEGAGEEELVQAAEHEGFTSLRQDGAQKVAKGAVSPREAMEVIVQW